MRLILLSRCKSENNSLGDEPEAGKNDSEAHKMTGVEEDSNELYNINIVTTGFDVYSLKPVVNMLLGAIHLSKMKDN